MQTTPKRRKISLKIAYFKDIILNKSTRSSNRCFLLFGTFLKNLYLPIYNFHLLKRSTLWKTCGVYLF